MTIESRRRFFFYIFSIIYLSISISSCIFTYEKERKTNETKKHFLFELWHIPRHNRDFYDCIFFSFSKSEYQSPYTYFIFYDFFCSCSSSAFLRTFYVSACSLNSNLCHSHSFLLLFLLSVDVASCLRVVYKQINMSKSCCGRWACFITLILISSAMKSNERFGKKCDWRFLDMFL